MGGGAEGAMGGQSYLRDEQGEGLKCKFPTEFSPQISWRKKRVPWRAKVPPEQMELGCPSAFDLQPDTLFLVLQNVGFEPSFPSDSDLCWGVEPVVEKVNSGALSSSDTVFSQNFRTS